MGTSYYKNTPRIAGVRAHGGPVPALRAFVGLQNGLSITRGHNWKRLCACVDCVYTRAHVIVRSGRRRSGWPARRPKTMKRTTERAGVSWRDGWAERRLRRERAEWGGEGTRVVVGGGVGGGRRQPVSSTLALILTAAAAAKTGHDDGYTDDDQTEKVTTTCRTMK